MKDLFPGYFVVDEKTESDDWDEALFVFDTNILLNLYRYSDETREGFMSILTELKDNIWLPNRVVEEYLKNRLSTIHDEEKAYNSTQKNIADLKTELKNSHKNPFVNKKLLKKAETLFQELSNELTTNKEIHVNRIKKDDIREKLTLLFEGKVGNPWSDKQLDTLITEGKERYLQKIPPGYMDSKKGGDSEIKVEILRKYGDLIIWKQIIEQAKSKSRNVVFVLDDKKEDWFEIFNKMAISARPELIQEFTQTTQKRVYFFTSEQFIKKAGTKLKTKLNKASVEEVKAVNYSKRAKKSSTEYLGGSIAMSDFEPEQYLTNDELSRLRAINHSINDYNSKAMNLALEIDKLTAKRSQEGDIINLKLLDEETWLLRMEREEIINILHKINSDRKHLNKTAFKRFNDEMIQRRGE